MRRALLGWTALLCVVAVGSVDIYFGPKAPTDKDANWVPTDPKGEFELLFRL